MNPNEFAQKYPPLPIIPADIEISQEAEMLPVGEIGRTLKLEPKNLEAYGKYKAKIENRIWEQVKDGNDGKLILVTAVTPTPAGEGKTCTSIGLAQAFGRLGIPHALALREPSMGPTFGIKGGAAGGGYSQVLPMEDINMHFTGDLHAWSTFLRLKIGICRNLPVKRLKGWAWNIIIVLPVTVNLRAA